jgi:MerR family copper efflux transcriptional regulator
MEGLTIHQAAETTGWSPRMLRYIENAGLIELTRSSSGYRLFGAEQLQRLRTLRGLLAQFDCALSDVAFAERLRSHEQLRAAVERWFEERPERPEGVASNDWLRWEQDKHQRLIQPETANSVPQEDPAGPTRLRETAA